MAERIVVCLWRLRRVYPIEAGIFAWENLAIERRNAEEEARGYESTNSHRLSGETETERMANGFAFSDVLSFGLTYKIKAISFDVRYGVRHVSNAELQQPNSGYNTTNLEVGILVDL